MVTRTIARPFAACGWWATVVRSLRGEVALVVMVNLVHRMLYQIGNIRQAGELFSPRRHRVTEKALNLQDPASVRSCQAVGFLGVSVPPWSKLKLGHQPFLRSRDSSGWLLVESRSMPGG